MSEQVLPKADTIWLLLFIVWLTALGSSLGALFIGEVMGQAPCNLCWFQRAFMFPIAVVMTSAVFTTDGRVWRYVAPLAAVGWLIAAFHNLLYFGIVPEAIKPCAQGPSCSGSDMMIFGQLPIPMLSLAAFSLIILSLLAVRKRIAK